MVSKIGRMREMGIVEKEHGKIRKGRRFKIREPIEVAQSGRGNRQSTSWPSVKRKKTTQFGRNFNSNSCKGHQCDRRIQLKDII